MIGAPRDHYTTRAIQSETLIGPFSRSRNDERQKRRAMDQKTGKAGFLVSDVVLAL
jgi:hypothetical protein